MELVAKRPYNFWTKNQLLRPLCSRGCCCYRAEAAEWGEWMEHACHELQPRSCALVRAIRHAPSAHFAAACAPPPRHHPLHIGLPQWILFRKIVWACVTNYWSQSGTTDTWSWIGATPIWRVQPLYVVQGLLEFIWTEGCSGWSSNPGPALAILVLWCR